MQPLVISDRFSLEVITFMDGDAELIQLHLRQVSEPRFHLLHVHLGHTIGVNSHLLLTIIHVLCDSKFVLISTSLVTVCALTKHDDLILSFSVLPTAEDEQVRADSC